MKLGRTAIILWLSCVFLPSANGSASADTLQLNFSGTWAFHDPQADSPDFWNAMASVGVGQGTPVTFSMLVDTADNNPDSAFGAYTIYSSALAAGGLYLTTLQQTLNLQPVPATTGSPGTTSVGIIGSNAWLGAPVGSWLPSYMQLTSLTSAVPVSQTDNLLTLLGNVNQLPELMLRIGFQQPGGCGLCMGTTRLTVTSVQSVPEPGALLLVAVGGLIAAGYKRRRQARHL